TGEAPSEAAGVIVGVDSKGEGTSEEMATRSEPVGLAEAGFIAAAFLFSESGPNEYKYSTIRAASVSTKMALIFQFIPERTLHNLKRVAIYSQNWRCQTGYQFIDFGSNIL